MSFIQCPAACPSTVEVSEENAVAEKSAGGPIGKKSSTLSHVLLKWHSSGPQTIELTTPQFGASV